jgi:hypothetical protein
MSDTIDPESDPESDPERAPDTAPETPPDAGLQRGWAALGERAVPRPDCPAPDRLWAAAAGEGTPDERQEIVLHIAGCASCAAAFRLARGLARDEGSADRGILSFSAGRRARLIRWAAPLSALAALLVIAVILPRLRPQSPPVYRGGAGSEIRSLVGSDERVPSLPRDAAELRWSPGPPGSRYEVRVLTVQGEEVILKSDLEEARYWIPATSLVRLSPGDLLYWQVTVSSPDGSRRTSPTFTLRLR